MAAPSTRKKGPSPKELEERIVLCRELLELEKKCAKTDARRKEIEQDLKKRATLADDGFRIDVPKLGYVTVAPERDKEFKGDVPVVVTEAWLALKEAERAKQLKGGLIVIEPQWSQKFYGRVTVKLTLPQRNAA